MKSKQQQQQQQQMNQTSNTFQGSGLNSDHNMNGHTVPNTYGTNLQNVTPNNAVNYPPSPQYGAGIHDMTNPMGNASYFVCKVDQHHFVEFV